MKFAHFILPRFNRVLIRALIGEFFATFLFMFAICGVSLANPVAASPAVGALCTAFAAVAAVYSFGDLSGAHFNPAVTFGAMMGARIPVIQGLMYWVVQLGATFVVCALLQLLHPRIDVFEALVIHPGVDVGGWRVVLMEGVLTFLLVVVVYGTVMGAAPKLGGVGPAGAAAADIERPSPDHGTSSLPPPPAAVAADPSKDSIIRKVLPMEMGGRDMIVVKPTALFAGLAIGFTLGFLSMLGGSVSGGAFNPARATAPAVIAKDVAGLWRYWVGDLAGALFAAIIFNFLMDIRPG